MDCRQRGGGHGQQGRLPKWLARASELHGRGRQRDRDAPRRVRSPNGPSQHCARLHLATVDDHALPTFHPTNSPPRRNRHSRCGNVPCVGNCEDSLDCLGACPFPSRLHSHVCERQSTTNTSLIDSTPSPLDLNYRLDRLSTFLQDADIQACAPVRQLSALKEELEAAQSPIMRTVFSWLFPFGPGWNSGASRLLSLRLQYPFNFRRTCFNSCTSHLRHCLY